MVRRLVLLCLGIGFGLLLAEGVLRIYFGLVPAPAGAHYVADEAAGYRLKADPPEHVVQFPDDHVNALGFRDREHPVVKPPRTLRIAGIGDSFVYGSTPSLADHFLEVAAARLAARLGPADSLDVEMILMGLGGYSPEHYVGVLESSALPLDPDLVILNVYVGNDVTAIPLRGEVWRGELYYTGSSYRMLDLLRHSRLFVLAERTLRAGVRGRLVEAWLSVTGGGRRGVEKRGKAEGGGTAPAAGRPAGTAEGANGGGSPGAAGTAGGVTVWQAHQQKKDLPVYLRAPDSRTEGLWRRAEACLAEFDRLCRAADVPWVLHLIPADIQVNGAWRDAVLAELRLESGLYDFDAPQRRLRAWAQGHDVRVIDPLLALRAAAVPDDAGALPPPLYERSDIHWTVRGNRLAGGFLGEALDTLAVPR